jgi:hypothetical protein
LQLAEALDFEVGSFILVWSFFQAGLINAN